jgi:putative transposase
MQYIGKFYVRNFNDKYTRTGTLFAGRFKSSVVQRSSYLANCLQYIELNPLRAGIVKDPGDYKWSS